MMRTFALTTLLLIAVGGPGWAQDCLDYGAMTRWLGNVDVPDRAGSLAIFGSYVFVGCSNKEIQVVDVADPATPFIATSWGTAGNPHVMLRDGHLLYVGVREAGIEIYDITDPLNAEFVGGWDSPGLVQYLALDGDLLWVADGAEGFHALDVTHPASPVVISTTDGPWDDISRIAAADSLAMVIDHWYRVSAYDVSDPAHPVDLGIYWRDWDLYRPEDLMYRDGIMFVQGYHTDFYPLSPPLVRVSLDAFDMRAQPVGSNLGLDYLYEGRASGIVPFGEDLAFIPTPGGQLKRVDLTDPVNPVAERIYSTAAVFRDVLVTENRAYVLDEISGLHILDLTQPDVADFVDGPWSYINTWGDFAMRDNIVYVSLHSFESYAPDEPPYLDFRLIDFSDRDSPRTLSRVEVDTHGAVNHMDVELSGDLAFLVSRGLYVIDISDPNDARLLADVDRITLDVDVVGDHAFAAAGDSGLIVYDVSEPAAPRRVATLSSGNLQRIERYGDLLYAMTADSSLQFIDVAEPTSPSQVGSFGSGFSGFEVVGNLLVAGRHAIAGRGSYSTLEILDITNPTDPAVLGFTAVPGPTLDVCSTGEMLYVAGGDAGMYVIDAANPASPQFVAAVNTDHAGTISLHGGELWLRAGNQIRILPLDCSDDAIVGIDDREDPPDDEGFPHATEITSVRPNPFNPATEVVFTTRQPGQVDLAVFDARGRLVRRLVSGHRPAGRHRERWDGRDDSGRIAPAGVYFLRLETPTAVRVRKAALVK